MATERRFPRLCVLIACAAGAVACSQQPSTTPLADSRPSIAERQAFDAMAQHTLLRLRHQIDSLERRERSPANTARSETIADLAHRRAVLDTLEQQLLAVTTASDATYGALCQIFLTYRQRHPYLRARVPAQGSLARMVP